MMTLCCKVLEALRGKTLVSAESLTGGGIGAALTAVPGSSEVYKGGIISYTNAVKETVLGVPREILEQYGAVSQWTAECMASGVRKKLDADVAVSVTGLAGPGGDAYGNPVSILLSEGQKHDSQYAIPLLDSVDIAGSQIAADRGYDANKIINYIYGWSSIRFNIDILI